MLRAPSSSKQPEPGLFDTMPRQIGDMSTPGQTPAQRVIHTSDAFFFQFVKGWLFFSALLCLYTALWEPLSLYAGVVCMVCGLVTRLLLQRGHTMRARWVFITPFFVMLMVAPWLILGVRTPLLVHMMLLLIFTGWMLGTRTMWCFALALSASLLAMWQAEQQGWWQASYPMRDADMWLLSLQFSLVMSAITVSALIRNYRVDIQREVRWHQLLQSTMQFNAAIMESSPVAMRVFGPQGQCLAVNAAYTHLMGEPRELLLAQSLYDSHLLRSGLTEECQHVMRSGYASQREVQLNTTSGRELWLGVHLVPVEHDGQRHLLVHCLDLTDQRRSTEELQQLAFYDSLTGLANRRLLWVHFQRTQHLCSRQQEWGAVLLLDLNRFKQLNDQYGHAVGDLMLQEVARRLQQCMRASDVIARLGGDEFTLLLQGMGRSETEAQHHLQLLREKLHAQLSQPYHLGDITHHASASIGGALIHPTMPNTLDALLREADAQMYAQKKLLATQDASSDPQQSLLP